MRKITTIPVNGEYIKKSIKESKYNLGNISKVLYNHEASLGKALARNRMKEKQFDALCVLVGFDREKALQTISHSSIKEENAKCSNKEATKEKIDLILEYQEKINNLLIKLIEGGKN